MGLFEKFRRNTIDTPTCFEIIFYLALLQIHIVGVVARNERDASRAVLTFGVGDGFWQRNDLLSREIGDIVWTS